MARARTIKQGFFTNDELGHLDPRVHLLFAGLWTIADRDGRLLDRPEKIRADVMPLRRVNVDDGLRQLAEHGFIQRYIVDGIACIQVVNWKKHQRPHVNEPASELPPPLPSNSEKIGKNPESLAPNSEKIGKTRSSHAPVPVSGLRSPVVGPLSLDVTGETRARAQEPPPPQEPEEPLPPEVLERLSKPPIAERPTDQRTNGRSL